MKFNSVIKNGTKSEDYQRQFERVKIPKITKKMNIHSLGMYTIKKKQQRRYFSKSQKKTFN